MERIPTNIIVESKLYDFIRLVRWEEGIFCPHCQSHQIRCISRKHHNFSYFCHTCVKHFTDLTGTIFDHTRIPMWKWIVEIYLLSLGESNQQIIKAININKKTQEKIAAKIRSRLWDFATDKLFCIFETDEISLSSSIVSDCYNLLEENKIGLTDGLFNIRPPEYEVRLLGIMIKYLLQE